MKKVTKVFSVMVASVALAAMLSGCGGDKKPAGGDTIKVGLLGPYTGDLAVYGLAVKNGATLYFDKVNAEGGINGKKIELISYDNKGDDAEAINAFNRELLAEHLRTCVTRDLKNGHEEIVDELAATLQKLMK